VSLSFLLHNTKKLPGTIGKGRSGRFWQEESVTVDVKSDETIRRSHSGMPASPAPARWLRLNVFSAKDSIEPFSFSFMPQFFQRFKRI